MLSEKFTYGKIQVNDIVQTGLEIKRYVDGRITVGQAKYTNELTMVYLSPSRRAEPASPTTSVKISAIRAANGKLGWLTRHTRIELCFDLAVSQQRANNSVVEDIMHLNWMVSEARRGSDRVITLHPIPLDRLAPLGYGDA